MDLGYMKKLIADAFERERRRDEDKREDTTN